MRPYCPTIETFPSVNTNSAVAFRTCPSHSFIFTNSLIPNFLMFSRFSIMLIPYFVLYLLSRFFSLVQGYFSHLKQNLVFFIVSQFLIIHLAQLTDLFVSDSCASGATLFLSEIGHTNPAVHPTRCN